GEEPGRVLIQTYNPESEPVAHVVTHDFSTFSDAELRRRQVLAYPPFTRMAALRIEGSHPDQTADVAHTLGNILEKRLTKGIRLLGPAPAPLARIKGKTRWQILLKGPSHAALGPLLAAVEYALPKLPQSVKVVIDVDPTAML